MPTQDEIRTEIRTIIEKIKEIIEASKSGGSFMLAMKIAFTIPDLLEIGSKFKTATALEKTDYCLEGFDEMVGEEINALLPAIGPLSPATTEKVTDALKDALREYFNKRFGSVPA